MIFRLIRNYFVLGNVLMDKAKSGIKRHVLQHSYRLFMQECSLSFERTMTVKHLNLSLKEI